MGKSDNLIKELRRILRANQVLSEPADLLCYSYDASPSLSKPPDAVVLPCTSEDVQNIMKFASENGIPVVPRGSGTNLSGGTVPVKGGIVISFSRMNKILEIDTKNLTALAEPGVITSDFCAAVEVDKLFYPPDPASAKVCTLGGNVAENAGGLRGLKYGVTRDYVLGLELVMPNAEVVNTGGKIRKNVAGYDFNSLMVGSEGTLAIITKILLRLVPLPESKITLLATFSTLVDSVSCVSEIIGVYHILPATLELMDKVTLSCVNDYLCGKIFPGDIQALLFIELDGDRTICEAQAAKIKGICLRNSADSVKMAENVVEIEKLTLARRSALSALSRVRPTTILEDVSIPPSRLVEMVDGIAAIAEHNRIQIGVFGHAGDGNLHPTIMTDDSDTDEAKRVENGIHEIFQLAVGLGGAITGEHGVGVAKLRYLPMQLSSSNIQIMRQIKRAFDPTNILNPGKIFH